MREFGDVLKEIRDSRSLSQEELANILNTSKQVISRYETGQRIPKISVVADYAQILGVDPRYLMGLDNYDIVSRGDGRTIKEVFARRLNLLREQKGYSQQDLANLIGISKSSINMFERAEREPSLEVMEAIADIFNVDIDYLYGKQEVERKVAINIGNSDRMTLGQIVKRFRETNKITMEEFSQKSGLSRGYISMLEKNENPLSKKPIVPSLTTIQAVSKVIGIDVNEIIEKLDPDQSTRLSEARDDTIETKALDSRLRSIETAYASLNDEGRQRLVQYADDLAGMEKYKRTDAPIKAVRSKKKSVRLPMAGVGEGGSSFVVKVDDEEEFNRKIEAAAKKAEERAYMDSHYSEIFGQKDGEDDN